ncbi:MAG: hypothetical protein JWO02_962 [Solirubrobacterales bacterium]|nr:hypothetical protein [Solirubrobacterales bacterium]
MALSPLASARILAGGRVLIGVALVVLPEQSSRPWLGDVSATAGAQVAVRALGIRDVLLGAITLHTLSHPQVGARWLQACAVADTVDAVATYAARDELPTAGAWGTIAMATVGAVDGLLVAAKLQRG